MKALKTMILSVVVALASTTALAGEVDYLTYQDYGKFLKAGQTEADRDSLALHTCSTLAFNASNVISSLEYDAQEGISNKRSLKDLEAGYLDPVNKIETVIGEKPMIHLYKQLIREALSEFNSIDQELIGAYSNNVLNQCITRYIVSPR